MINELIKEISTALQNDCWFIALNTALTLPDICGKAEYSDTCGQKQRYTKWLNKYGRLHIDNFIRANDIYNLRCCMLHQGTPSTKQSGKNIEEFELIVNSNEQSNITMEAIYSTSDKYVLSVNVLHICRLLCSAAKSYYESNKAKFDFFKYRVVSVDYRTANMFSKEKDLFKIDFD